MGSFWYLNCKKTAKDLNKSLFVKKSTLFWFAIFCSSFSNFTLESFVRCKTGSSTIENLSWIEIFLVFDFWTNAKHNSQTTNLSFFHSFSWKFTLSRNLSSLANLALNQWFSTGVPWYNVRGATNNWKSLIFRPTLPSRGAAKYWNSWPRVPRGKKCWETLT